MRRVKGTDMRASVAEAREPRGSKAEAMASWDLGFGFYSERSKMTFHSFCNSLRNQAALSQFH